MFRYLKAVKAIRSTLPQPVTNVLDSVARKSLQSARFRSYGLLPDDLIIEEHDVVKEALTRVPKHELHGRYQRFKVALHTNMLRTELPKEQWTRMEDDRKYLTPFVEQVLAEHEEREKYDNGLFQRS